ncbi:MAG: homoserine O-succinyltransferase [Eubacteriales bacterium]|nr:homoserine O-succinyltransferase [Eubacteriales bacterium]
MPVKIPNDLPAAKTLTDENIFVMTHSRAASQDIRPLQIAIFNLMPTKETTETQLLRLLGNTALQVEVTLLHTASYTSRHTTKDHLTSFYRTFDEVRNQKFDGLIVTGAPVEQMPFEDVAYWPEICRVFRWAETHVFSVLFICWAAQAALHYYYGIEKQPLPHKLFGVYPHRVLQPTHRLLRGFDDVFYAPHSRHTTVRVQDVAAVSDLEVLSVSEQAGLYLAASRDGSRVFVTGHSEYDPTTLEQEFLRDQNAGLAIEPPFNYYPGNDSSQPPQVTWRSHGNLLFGNWLNYFVYQETPYDIESVKNEQQPVSNRAAV